MQRILQKAAGTAIISLLAVAVAFLICSVMLVLQGVNPLQAFSAIAYGAAGNIYSVFSSVTAAVPLAIAAFGVVVSFKAGVYNIGVEGQLFMGGLFAAIVGTRFVGMPALLHLPLCLAAGILGGMLWALLPALMKVVKGFNEVITTVLMNYIAIYIVSFAVSGPMRPESVYVNQSAPIEPSAVLPRFAAGYEINYGLLLMLVMLVLVTFLMRRSTWGFRIRAVGINPAAAASFGMRANRVAISAFLASGALAGLAGSVEVLGNQGILAENFAVGMGYNAIAVALLGGVSAPGSLLAALFMGCLRNGGIMLQIKLGISATMMNMIQAILILTVLCFSAIKFTFGVTRKKEAGANA